MSSSGHSWSGFRLRAECAGRVMASSDVPIGSDSVMIVLVVSQLRPAALWVTGSLCGPAGLRRMSPLKGDWRLLRFGGVPGQGTPFLGSKKNGKGGAWEGLVGGDSVGFDPISKVFILIARVRGRVVSWAFEIYPDWVPRGDPASP
eukprot:4867648-Heterocapsa_arctica.AAC.1